MDAPKVDLNKDLGTDPEELRQAIIALRLEVESRRYFDFLTVSSLRASNISIQAGSGAESPVGTVGKDPQSQNIWGFIAERGYGFYCRYLKANYARFFMDATNDQGQLTPSSIMDMASPNKFVFKDNEGLTIFRVYGGHGQEVQFASNYFDPFGASNGGAFDLFVPMRYLTFDYAGGTSGGPESARGYSYQGFMYYRQNYGSEKISDLRLFDGNTWKSVQTYHPEATPGNPFVADNVAVREVVTVTIS